ncbi:PREDICTED: uncharacterized protein C20orf85 homolog [Chlamydotis macqueenii]|uniref:uncharacterized protein C20orf85 homolog n=1 Tax=Chlamydotis macqueenii TaxID=187382 RepID=UPI000529AFAB|nr:PREDICTED: uncharacterized protein C20orf85 homolog [Chlamydotis macqueenii]
MIAGNGPEPPLSLLSGRPLPLPPKAASSSSSVPTLRRAEAEGIYLDVHFMKKYIENELKAAIRWSHKWGFLKTPLEELIQDEKKEDKKPKIQLPEHLQVRPVTPVEKHIKVMPSPPVPKTTQGFIGWRSAVPGLELERGVQIQSSKGSFWKDLKWPCEPSD